MLNKEKALEKQIVSALTVLSLLVLKHGEDMNGEKVVMVNQDDIQKLADYDIVTEKIDKKTLAIKLVRKGEGNGR